MKQKIQKIFITFFLFGSMIFLSGCNDEVQKTLNAIQDLVQKTFNLAEGEVKKAINPLPKCSDSAVMKEVNNKLTHDALYGTHATLKFGTIVMTGENEQTDERFCKGVVTYTIDEKDNKISSFLSKMPIIKNVSKDRTINYSIARHETNDKFVIHIK